MGRPPFSVGGPFSSLLTSLLGPPSSVPKRTEKQDHSAPLQRKDSSSTRNTQRHSKKKESSITQRRRATSSTQKGAGKTNTNPKVVKITHHMKKKRSTRTTGKRQNSTDKKNKESSMQKDGGSSVAVCPSSRKSISVDNMFVIARLPPQYCKSLQEHHTSQFLLQIVKPFAFTLEHQIVSVSLSVAILLTMEAQAW